MLGLQFAAGHQTLGWCDEKTSAHACGISERLRVFASQHLAPKSPSQARRAALSCWCRRS